MGSDPERLVVNAHGECHNVRRLFVGDSSVVPRTLSVNPSLTIMALASRLAAYLAGDEHGYLPRAGRVPAAAAQGEGAQWTSVTPHSRCCADTA